MKFNPFNTLAGRLVAVTIVAIAISHIVAFWLFASERSNSFRREAESRIAERIVDVANSVRDLTPAEQTQLTHAASNRGMRFWIVRQSDAEGVNGAASRIADLVSGQLNGAQVHARTRDIILNWRPRLRDVSDTYGTPAPPPDQDHRGHPVTLITVDVALGPSTWLRSTALVPAPRPVPDYLWIGALASMILVGLSAVLLSRQIGRPLADLARAADRLGWGETGVAAPVSGPDDVRRASTAFNSMAERLGRQMGRQRHMLWALSHDLRTPITALRLRAELIEDEAAKQRLLGPIAEMETLTEQALALARAGASEETRENVDLAEIARTLCGELEDMGVAIRAEAETPVFAQCRPSEIARAMRNLAENAAKHGGGGVMKVTRGAHGEAIIEVADDGPGLPDDLIPRVTEPFFRSDTARTESCGAGLGLAIAQAIADGHGGKLELSNRQPHGLSAKLILPG